MLPLIISFAAGSLAALSPCILPVLPIVVGSSASKSKKSPLFLAMGIITSLVVIGLVFSSMTKFLGINEDQVRLSSSVMLIFFGIVLFVPSLRNKFSLLLNPLSNSSFKTSRKFENAGSLGQFMVGALLGLAWSPCVGPTLGIAMSMASIDGQRIQAALMMFTFGLGLSIPLLSIAYGLKGLFQKKRNLLLQINRFSNPIMGASAALIGIMIITGADKKFEAAIVANLPDWYFKFSSYL